MNTYLVIITTALIVTQIIRVVQNSRQLKKYTEQLKLLKDKNELQEANLKLQRTLINTTLMKVEKAIEKYMKEV